MTIDFAQSLLGLALGHGTCTLFLGEAIDQGTLVSVPYQPAQGLHSLVPSANKKSVKEGRKGMELEVEVLAVLG